MTDAAEPGMSRDDVAEIWPDDHVVTWAKEIGIAEWSPAAGEHQPRCRDCEWTGMYRCRECGHFTGREDALNL